MIALTVGLACLPASRASASSINYLGSGQSDTVSIQSPVLGNLTVHAGELKWEGNGAAPSGYSPSHYYTYCVDVNNYMLDPEEVTLRSTTELSNPGVTDSGGRATWPFNNNGDTVHASGNSAEVAALQMAIWAALYNPTNSLPIGPFKLFTTGAVATRAQDHLNALYAGPAGVNSDVTWLDAEPGAGQDLPGQDLRDRLVSSALEPASLLLCATGLAWLARALRRRRPTVRS